MQKIDIVISGRVQGVGFRYFTLKKAELYQIKGYVKNLPSGKVKVVAMGDPGNLESFTRALKNGPTSSYITSFVISPLECSKEYQKFEILY